MGYAFGIAFVYMLIYAAVAAVVGYAVGVVIGGLLLAMALWSWGRFFVRAARLRAWTVLAAMLLPPLGALVLADVARRSAPVASLTGWVNTTEGWTAGMYPVWCTVVLFTVPFLLHQATRRYAYDRLLHVVERHPDRIRRRDMDDTWRWHDEVMRPTPWFEAPVLRGLSDAVNRRPAVAVVIGWTMYAVFAGPILVNIFVGPPS